MKLAILGIAAMMLAGCGDGNSSHQASPTATVAGATATPSPTTTPTTPAPEHSEILVGSTADGAGALRIHEELDGTIEVPFDQCLGGNQANRCSGGVQLFEATTPGFESAEESEPDEGLFVLPETTLVRLVLVSAPPSTQLRFANTTLDQTGEVAALGEVPFHADVEWQIAIPGGEVPPAEILVVVRLTTTSSAYSSSSDLQFRLVPTL